MNIEQQIEALKSDFNSKLDDLKKQLTDNSKDALLEIEALKNEKPKFEVGKWYKYSDSKIHLVCFRDVEKFIGFGICNTGWCNDNTWTSRDLVLATPKEVEEHLIAEAKKRGFKEGVVGIPPSTIKQKDLVDNFCKKTFYYNSGSDILFAASDCDGGLPVYCKGVWAEIIKEDKLFLDKEQKYEIEFGKTAKDGIWYSVVIDGYGFTKQFFVAAERCLTNNKASVLLGCDAKTKGTHSWLLTKELNDKILEKLK